MSKEMQELKLEICIILTNKLNKRDLRKFRAS